MKEIEPRDFSDVKVGDVVVRLLAGVVPMKLRVTEVTDDRILCGISPSDNEPLAGEPWAFDRKTGIEEDERFGWGVKYGATGSYLVAVEPMEEC